MDSYKNAFECAIIRSEIVKKSPTYEKDGSSTSFNQTFSVLVKDIENTVNFIKLAYEEAGLPYARIYLSGFALLPSSSLCTKEKIVSIINRQANTLKSIEQSTKSFRK